MSPIRIVIIAILIYIGYLLVRGGRGVKTKKRNIFHDAPDTSDVLVEDPVCKKLVPRRQAVKLQHKDTIYYFCSDECCRTFVSERGDSK